MTTTQTQPVLTAEQRVRQTEILRYGDGSSAYFFAHHIPGADIPALQARVLEVGDGFDAYFFAKDIPGADLPALQARVLERGNGWVVYRLARDIPGADIVDIQLRLLKVGKAVEVFCFARDIPGADISILYARAEMLKFAGLDQLQRDDFKARFQAFQDSLSDLTDSVSSESTPSL